MHQPSWGSPTITMRNLLRPPDMSGDRADASMAIAGVLWRAGVEFSSTKTAAAQASAYGSGNKGRTRRVQDALADGPVSRSSRRHRGFRSSPSGAAQSRRLRPVKSGRPRAQDANSPGRF